MLNGNTPEDWRSAFYYQHFDIHPDGELANCGVRTEDFKLIWYNHNYDRYQLFDLKSDPSETRDVSEDPEYASTVRDMKALLQSERAKARLDTSLGRPDFYQRKLASDTQTNKRAPDHDRREHT